MRDETTIIIQKIPRTARPGALKRVLPEIDGSNSRYARIGAQRVGHDNLRLALYD